VNQDLIDERLDTLGRQRFGAKFHLRGRHLSAEEQAYVVEVIWRWSSASWRRAGSPPDQAGTSSAAFKAGRSGEPKTTRFWVAT
jgi:hypothetical protein